jgi:VRR-NUC domain
MSPKSKVLSLGSKVRRVDWEHREQVALMRWAGLARQEFPELELLFAIPNGGARNVIVASKLKAEGVKRGVPDLCLPVARHGWHGLFIELKAPGGRATPEQAVWLEKLTQAGYLARLCVGWEAAERVIRMYLGKVPAVER